MEEHSLHTNNQPLPTESEKMTTKEEVALRHHFLLTNTKREVKLTIKGSFLSCFSDLYKGNKILSNSQEKEPTDYLTE